VPSRALHSRRDPDLDELEAIDEPSAIAQHHYPLETPKRSSRSSGGSRLDQLDAALNELETRRSTLRIATMRRARGRSYVA
jgi:hypothetical protein